MFTNIDLNNPDLMVNLDTLGKAVEIYDILRAGGVKKKYCYALLYRKNLLQYDIIKIGESCPEPKSSNTSHAVGERLGRQIGWLDGWSSYPRSDNGMDLRFNMQTEIGLNKLPANVIHKDNITVAVWNLDNRVPTVVVGKDRDITQWVEGELAQQYKSTHNYDLPVLNYKDPTKNKAYLKGYVTQNLVNQLWTFV